MNIIQKYPYILIGMLVIIALIVLTYLFILFKRDKKQRQEERQEREKNAVEEELKLQQRMSIPGTKLIIRLDCTVTKIEPVTINYGYDLDFIEVNHYFKEELINRGIDFKTLTVKDLGYTWIDQANKKGYNQYELEYWNWKDE